MVSNVPKTRPAYPPEFRREAVQMLRAGRAPRELAQSLGVSEQPVRQGGAYDNAVAESLFATLKCCRVRR
jgi:transposase